MSDPGTLVDIPNLDDLSVDPDDYIAASEILDTLAAYARVKARAVRARLNGNIAAAQHAEEMLGHLYLELPEGARW